MTAPITGRTAWFIYGAAFAVRFLVFLYFQPWLSSTVESGILVGDAPAYHRLAQCMLTDRSFCGETFRTPGYPFFIALVYAIGGVKPWLVLFLQIFLDLISIYLISRIGEIAFSKRTGIIAAALFAFDPTAIFTTTTLMSESLFVALTLGALYAYFRGQASGRWGGFLAAGILLAAAALVRPVAQYYMLIMVAFAVAWNMKSIGAGARSAAVLVLAFGVAASPWLWRNYALYDAPKLSSIQGENLLFWQVTYARVSETKKSPESVEQEFQAEVERRGYRKDGNPFRNESIAQKVALEYIVSHPAFYASRLASGIFHTFANLNTAGFVSRLGIQPTDLPPDVMFAADSEAKLVAAFFKTKSTAEIFVGMATAALLFINYLSFVFGAAMLLKRRQFALLGLFVASIGYFALSGGVIGLARFRVPASPFYLLIGAFFISSLFERRSRGSVRAEKEESYVKHAPAV